MVSIVTGRRYSLSFGGSEDMLVNTHLSERRMKKVTFGPLRERRKKAVRHSLFQKKFRLCVLY